MANHAQGPVDSDAIAKAEYGWKEFTKFSKYTIIGVVAVLILMAIFLL